VVRSEEQQLGGGSEVTSALPMKDIVIGLLRPKNLAIATIAVIISIHMSGGSLGLEALLVTLSANLIMGGGNVINAYFDRDVDKKNPLKKNPVSLNLVSPGTARRLAGMLFLSGWLAVLPLRNALTMGIASSAVLLLIAYTPVLKHKGILNGLASNITIAVLTGLLYVYGWSVAGARPGIAFNIVIYASVFSALATLAREVIKGIADYSPDRITGIKTVATQNGTGVAITVASGTLFALVLLSPFPFIEGIVSEAYVPLVLATDLALLLSALPLWFNLSEETADLARKRVRSSMILGLLAFVFGTAVVVNDGLVVIRLFGYLAVTLERAGTVPFLNNITMLSMMFLAVVAPVLSYKIGKNSKVNTRN